MHFIVSFTSKQCLHIEEMNDFLMLICSRRKSTPYHCSKTHTITKRKATGFLLCQSFLTFFTNCAAARHNSRKSINHQANRYLLHSLTAGKFEQSFIQKKTVTCDGAQRATQYSKRALNRNIALHWKN